MNIRISILIVSILVNWTIGTLNAQTILRTENFESFTADEYLILNDTSNNWSVYNEMNADIEDAYVVNDTSTSGANSVLIDTYNSIVYKLDKRTESRYELQFNAFIKQWEIGFFRIAQEYPTDTVKTGLEFYFDTNGEGFFYASNKTYRFSYENEKWLTVKVIIDIDDDFATLFIDEQEIAYFRWDGGSTGLTGVSSIEGLHFFGIKKPNSAANSQMYIDDITFSQLESVVAPMNFTASIIDNNTTLTWEEPTAYTPISYLVFRNSEVIDTVYTTSYIENNLHPGSYSYNVRANTDTLGYSVSSEIIPVNIEGGIDRELTLFEIFTGTWCGYCPGSALAADDLIHNGDNVAIIEYHNGDPYQVDHGEWRRTKYYNVASFPTALVDGGQQLSWGNPTQSVYPIYKPMHDKATEKPALHNITTEVNWISPLKYELTVNIQELYKYFKNLKLQVAVTESHIEQEWQGLNELNFVLKRMYPNAQGTNLDFSTTTEYTKTFTIELEEGAVVANTEIVVFVQDTDTKEVSQATKLNLGTVGLSEERANFSSIYPNPTNNYVQISCSNTEEINTVEIYNINGVLVHKLDNMHIDNKISLEHFNNGLYLIKINHNNGKSEFHKVIKN